MTRRPSGVLRVPPMFLVAAVTFGLAGVSSAIPARGLIHREIVVLQVKILNAARINPSSTPLKLSVDPDRGGTLEFSVLWPGPAEQTTIKLQATETAALGDLRRIHVKAELVLPDGTRVQSERRLEVREATTTLFELFRLNDRPLTLALDGSLVTETILPGRPTAGRPVTLNLAIQHVNQGLAVPLETNRLNTFVGESVTYQFRLGPGTDSASVRLTMTPIRITGDLVELDVDLTGTLPGDVLELISRHERLVATLATSLVFGLESGDPPSGYRFVVTPLF